MFVPHRPLIPRRREEEPRRRRRPSARIVVVVFLLLIFVGGPSAVAGEEPPDSIGADGGGETLSYSKLSGIIIPGFASTQLRAWSVLDCPYSPLDFNPLDLVWLDSTRVILRLHS